MNKKITILTVLVMMLTFTFIGTGYSLDCGDTIYNDTTLDCDLDCSDTAIIIGNPGITLHLNGYTLRGAGEGTGVKNIDGCCGEGCDGVTIKDGTIDGFRCGIKLDKAHDNTLEELEIRNSSYKGIDVESSTNSVVRECLIVGKTNVTMWGIYLDGAISNGISESIIIKNVIGLELYGEYSNCALSSMTNGNNTVSQNTFKNNKFLDVKDNNYFYNIYDENKCKKSDPPEICQPIMEP